jgi:hypothetical protein
MENVSQNCSPKESEENIISVKMQVSARNPCAKKKECSVIE